MSELAAEEVFRQNLHKLAAARKLEFDGLAAALGFHKMDRKWLRRAWEDGMKWPDKRSKPKLEKVSAFFAIESTDLWSVKFQLQPKHTMQDYDHWQGIVESVVTWHRFLQQAKGRMPQKMRMVLEPYAFKDAPYLADIVASERGQRPRPDTGWLDELIPVLQRESDHHDLVFGPHYLHEQLQAHPEFEQFRRTIEEVFSDRLGEAATDDAFFTVLAEVTNSLQWRVLTPPEVYQQVVRFFLDGEHPELEKDDRIVEIITELELHPMWRVLCEKMEGGIKYLNADEYVADKWAESKKTWGDEIQPGHFVSYFTTHILEPLTPSDQDDSRLRRGEDDWK